MSEDREFRIGIDVGGTNTDAVVIDAEGSVVSAVKVATTPEPIDGIRESLSEVLQGTDSAVAKTMLGTSPPTNPSFQRRGLDSGVCALAAPSLGVRRARPGTPIPGHGHRVSAIIEGGTSNRRDRSARTGEVRRSQPMPSPGAQPSRCPGRPSVRHQQNSYGPRCPSGRLGDALRVAQPQVGSWPAGARTPPSSTPHCERGRARGRGFAKRGYLPTNCHRKPTSRKRRHPLTAPKRALPG